MLTLIHGSNRRGYCWEITCALSEKLKELGTEVIVVDISTANINYCCGDQICQDGDCVLVNDDFSDVIKEQIINTDGIYIITPTYFNMPPGKLKNFIDRTNALLPLFENTEKKPFFGAYVCGEADNESISNNLNLLKEYASVMGWGVAEQLNDMELITDVPVVDNKRIDYLANLIYKNLQSKGE